MKVLTYNGETLTVPQWSERLGISKQTIHARIKSGFPIEEILYIDKIVRPSIKHKDENNNILESICWDCQHAVPNSEGTKGCSWCKHFKPVDGWTATKTVLMGKNGEAPVDSFKVTACPQFLKDEKNYKIVNDIDKKVVDKLIHIKKLFAK